MITSKRTQNTEAVQYTILILQEFSIFCASALHTVKCFYTTNGNIGDQIDMSVYNTERSVNYKFSTFFNTAFIKIIEKYTCFSKKPAVHIELWLKKNQLPLVL